MAPGENPSRDAILGRIRAALGAAEAPPAPAAAPAAFAPIPDVLERFKTECAANLTELVLVSGAAAVAEALEKTLVSLSSGELFAQDAPELRAVAGRFAGRTVRWSSEGSPRESTQASLTLAELLVARTGSIFVSAACGGRAASVAPDCHIVIARESQLVPDLETALARVVARGLPSRHSYLGLITGSSRTADIEKMLVLGAHGPRRLVCILETGS